MIRYGSMTDLTDETAASLILDVPLIDRKLEFAASLITEYFNHRKNGVAEGALYLHVPYDVYKAAEICVRSYVPKSVPVFR